MNQNGCDAFAEEIGAYIGSGARLGADAAAHVQECAQCREKMAELEGVAAIQEAVTARIPEPKRRLHRRQLERLIEERREGVGAFRWIWPAAAGFAAMVVLAGFLMMREKGGVPGVRREVPTVASGTVQKGTEEAAVAPTILALHQDLAKGREMLASDPGGGAMRHYRVRDAEMELRN